MGLYNKISNLSKGEINHVSGASNEMWCYYGYNTYPNVDQLDPSRKDGIGGSDERCPLHYSDLKKNSSIEIITDGAEKLGHYVFLRLV